MVQQPKKWEEYFKILLTETRDEFQINNTSTDFVEQPILTYIVGSQES